MKVEIDYPGVCSEKTPAGTRRWRVRVQGEKTKKITIPVAPGHADFAEHYDAAREGRKLPLKVTKKRRSGSLDELREQFCAAMAEMVAAGNLNAKTLEGRTRGLKQACDVKKSNVRIGSMNAKLPIEAFTQIIDSYRARTGAAETCLKALKAAYRWGEGRGFPSGSPVLALSSPHKGRGGAKKWREEDEQKFLACHGKGTMARRWFYLAKNMAGRIGDTHTMGPHNVQLKQDQVYLGWQPQKRGSKFVKVPVMAELAAELDAAPVHEEAFLTTNYGKPFATSGSLDNRIRKWIIEAGLFVHMEVLDPKTQKMVKEKKATRSQHGIRKLVAHEIANAGGSVYEIMARLSHSDTRTAMVYTGDFEREALAKLGFERVQNQNEN